MPVIFVPSLRDQLEYQICLKVEAVKELHRLRSQLDEIGTALPSGARYLDPPDGGDVGFPEQIRRIVSHVDELEDILRQALDALAFHDRDLADYFRNNK